MITRYRYALALLMLPALALLNLQADGTLTLADQWRLLLHPGQADSFADQFFTFAQLPRLAMGALVGALLGLTGSLFQQLTQNPLTSPLTLGTTSGAWLALVIMNIWLTDQLADYSALAALAGALLAFGFVVLIAGPRQLTGLPLVVSGMVVNLLLGAIATALITLHAQFAQNIFIWGAGDLTQQGWQQVRWLLWRSAPALLILALAPRLLTLLRLGQQGAAARGLAVWPLFLLFIVLGSWLAAAAITTVGVISFVGLLAPNLVRAVGVRSAGGELVASMLAGAALLLGTDSLALLLSQALDTLIPSGVAAAAIGAPALILFSRRPLRAGDQLPAPPLSALRQPRRSTVALLMLLLLAGLALTAFTQHGGVWRWPGPFQWALRWPRLLAALSAGVALALAGALLQRLIANPLASPDMLGVSAGATVALIVVTLLAGAAAPLTSWSVAFAGSLLVLAALLILSRRQHFAPASLILTGIALSACLQALVQFFLAKGSLNSYRILLWLSGSTYRVSAGQAIGFALAVLLLSLLIVLLARGLTLLTIGSSFARARGLAVQQISLLTLAIVALLCALVTATVGPLAFVGLVAPHMAQLCGAQRLNTQLALSALIGATLLVWADWAGQHLIWPAQIAAGTLAAILGGVYFLALMLASRLQRRGLRR